MSTDVHSSYFLAESYGPRLQKIDEGSRALLAEYQALQPPLVSPDMDVTNLRGAGFPRSSVERIRDSALGEEERQKAMTYLLGCWYIDQVDGAWDFVPMLVDKPALYLSFGLGVRTENGSMLIVAESAREIMEGGDLAFTESLYTSSVKAERRLAEERSRSEEARA